MGSGSSTHLNRAFYAAVIAAGFASMGAQAIADDGVFMTTEQPSPIVQLAQADIPAQLDQTPSLTIPTQDIAAKNTESVRNVHLDPLMPLPLIAGFAALYAALGVYPFRRRIKGAFFRAAAGVTLTALMLNPVLSTQEREILPTEALIILDRSASQRLDHRAFETTEIYTQIQAMLDDIPNVSIRVVEVGATGTLDPAASNGTQLYESIRQTLSEIPRDQLGAIFVITDGVIEDVPEEAFIAIEDDIPTHFLITGHEAEFDRRVEIVSAPQFGMIKTTQDVELRVVDDGALQATEPVTVTVSAQGEVIQQYQTRIGEVLSIDVELDLTGANIYEFSVDSVEGELTDVNNTAYIEVTGIREDLNVLMLSGEPSQSGRYLRSIFRADPGANLVHLNMLRPPGKPQTVPLGEVSLIPVPVNEILGETLSDFDLIVLDRYRMSGILNYQHFANIRQFVEDGGALLLINDDEFLSRFESLITSQIMRDLLPVEVDERLQSREGVYTPSVSEEGQRHPITRGLQGEDEAWGRWLTMISSNASEGANILLETESGDPLLIVNRIGEGRVAMVMSDNFWLWANGYDGGGPAEELLQSLSHWLMAYPELEEENVSLALSDDGQRLIVTRQTLSAEVGEPVRLTTPTGEEIEVGVSEIAPGLHQGEIAITDLGLYRVEQQRDLDGDAGETLDDEATISDFLSVGPANPREFDYTLSATEFVQPYLTTNLGTVTRAVTRELDANSASASTIAIPSVSLMDADERNAAFADNDTLAIRATDSFVLRANENNPLIPAWLGMIGALSLFAGAWYREGGGKALFRRKTQKTAADNATPKPS